MADTRGARIGLVCSVYGFRFFSFFVSAFLKSTIVDTHAGFMVQYASVAWYVLIYIYKLIIYIAVQCTTTICNSATMATTTAARVIR